MSAYLSLAGLAIDVIGFGLIGWEMLTHPYTRFYEKENDITLYNRGRIGFFLVVLGFLIQASAQLNTIFSGQ